MLKLAPLTQSKFFVLKIFWRAIIENSEKISELNSKKSGELGLTDSDPHPHPQLGSELEGEDCKSPKGDSGSGDGGRHVLNEVIN